MNGQKITQKLQGSDWSNGSVEKSSGIKPGIYNIYNAKDVKKSEKNIGIVIHYNVDSLYQKTSKGIVRHSIKDFESLPALGTDKKIEYNAKGKAIVTNNTLKSIRKR